MAKLYVNPNVKKGHINPELQGHFSEHLGRCIYEGIYVGENSDIPNVNGMRTDVVEAQGNQSSRAALAGWLLCRRVPLEGWYRTQGGAQEDD